MSYWNRLKSNRAVWHTMLSQFRGDGKVLEVGCVNKRRKLRDGARGCGCVPMRGVCLVQAAERRGGGGGWAALEVVMRQRLEVGGARPHFFSTSAPAPPPPSDLFLGELHGAHFGEIMDGKKRNWRVKAAWITSKDKNKTFSPLCLIIKKISLSF